MLSPHWGNILSVLDSLLAQLKENHVPAFLVRKLFQQLFSFVNVQLFNQLLLRRECCSFSNGEYVKTGLAEVENWIHTAGKDWVGESWDELRYIRQVINALQYMLSFGLLSILHCMVSDARSSGEDCRQGFLLRMCCFCVMQCSGGEAVRCLRCLTLNMFRGCSEDL